MSRTQAEFISPPNTLRKAKVGNGKAKLDPVLLAKADAVVDRMRQNYADWADEDLTMLEKTLSVRPETL
jgi:hypothetical protein